MPLADFRSLFTAEPKRTWRSGLGQSGGPTIAALSNAVGEGRNASGMVHVQAYEQGRDGKTVQVSDYERRRPGDAGGASSAGGGSRHETL